MRERGIWNQLWGFGLVHAPPELALALLASKEARFREPWGVR
jgi:hypothetical protein